MTSSWRGTPPHRSVGEGGSEGGGAMTSSWRDTPPHRSVGGGSEWGGEITNSRPIGRLNDD